MSTSRLFAAFIFLVGVLFLAPSAQTNPQARLTALVANQQCLTDDDVFVTYTATLDPPRDGTLYRWDFNNDGLFDTDANPDPTAHTGYPQNVIVTARVQATSGDKISYAKIRYRTMRCQDR